MFVAAAQGAGEEPNGSFGWDGKGHRTHTALSVRRDFGELEARYASVTSSIPQLLRDEILLHKERSFTLALLPM